MNAHPSRKRCSSSKVLTILLFIVISFAVFSMTLFLVHFPDVKVDRPSLTEMIEALNESDQQLLLQHFQHLMKLPEPEMEETTSKEEPTVEFWTSRKDLKNYIRNTIPPDFLSLKKDEFMSRAVETIISSQEVSFSNNDSSRVQSLVSELQQLPVPQLQYVMNMVNGREFPYPLSCPKYTLRSQHVSIIISYHVGMVKNWRNIVTDQLNTLEVCGLGQAMDKMILTYTKNDTVNTVEDLLLITSRFSFASKIIHQMGTHVLPYEAPALNALRDSCMAQENGQDDEKKMVAFYFHNKGCSHYQHNWREKQVIHEWGSYSHVLFWRKYLEYFLLERPEICIDQIVNHGASACGAHMIDDSDHGIYFSGNFWAASCTHLKSLKPVSTEIVTGDGEQYSRLYTNGEKWIGRHLSHKKETFVCLHNNTNGLYKHLIGPDEYSDYSYRWNL